MKRETPGQLVSRVRYAMANDLPIPDPETEEQRDALREAFPDESHRWRPSREAMRREDIDPRLWGVSPDVYSRSRLQKILRAIYDDREAYLDMAYMVRGMVG